jgi:putative radical SAM enzyme (TIGR03279 family)
MIKNKFAGNVYDRLKRMAEAGIKMNCQIVLCPGINDGDELERTIEDLYKLYPKIENIAAVPVGVTKYRHGLYEMELYNKITASAQLDRVWKLQERYIKEVGAPFIRLSDEFYVTAEREIPSTEFYGGFNQLEDGVGMIRIFRNNIQSFVSELKKDVKGCFTIITGVSAYNELVKAVESINQVNPRIKINVKKIVNNFFGKTITVAGLITSKDIIDQLKDEEIGDYVIVPDCMLRKGYELSSNDEKVFLDDITIDNLSKALNRKILICDYTGEDLISNINEYCKEE